MFAAAGAYYPDVPTSLVEDALGPITHQAELIIILNIQTLERYWLITPYGNPIGAVTNMTDKERGGGDRTDGHYELEERKTQTMLFFSGSTTRPVLRQEIDT